MMQRIINWEQLRMIVVTVSSSVAAYMTPTKGFIIALTIMFAFNIFCGMRADGVAVKRCRNFKMSKFRHALVELLLYLLIIETVYFTMLNCGDAAEALAVVKTITYVFMYVYVCNAFRNLVVAYPREKAFHIIYHLIRFEFRRAIPEYVSGLIDRYDREHGECAGSEEGGAECQDGR